MSSIKSLFFVMVLTLLLISLLPGCGASTTTTQASTSAPALATTQAPTSSAPVTLPQQQSNLKEN